jgi:hypothetical protein
MVFLAASCVNAGAQERIGGFVLLHEHKAAVLTGEISSDTNASFDAVLGRMPDLKVLGLNSPGGQVVAALEIANKIHALRLTTVIPESMDCASACSILFLAGSERFPEGGLGVHQLSTREPGDLQAVQLVISDILDAFERFGVDPRVTKQMLTTPPQDMYFFSDGEKEEYLIARGGQAHAAPATASAAPRPPELRFADFPPSYFYGSDPVLPEFKGDDEWAGNFRTRIRDGIAGGVNYAGRYTIIEIGCGTSCRIAVMVDVSNGDVIRFPLGGEENYELEMTYTSESTLLKAVWKDEAGDGYENCVKQDYGLEDGQLKLLAESRYTVKEFGYCSAYN